MRTHLWMLVFGVLALGSFALAVSDDKPDHSGKADGHVALTPDDLKWGAGPPSLPNGARLAVLQGDPRKAGEPYTFRVKLPDGFTVPPHWHPVDENVTVIQGTFMVGYGDIIDKSKSKELPAGSYARMPKGVRHFAWAKGEVIVQVHGTGPFDIHYVNPADDPRNKKSR